MHDENNKNISMQQRSVEQSSSSRSQANKTEVTGRFAIFDYNLLNSVRVKYEVGMKDEYIKCSKRSCGKDVVY
jgi:hypothetical protein